MRSWGGGASSGVISVRPRAIGSSQRSTLATGPPPVCLGARGQCPRDMCRGGRDNGADCACVAGAFAQILRGRSIVRHAYIYIVYWLDMFARLRVCVRRTEADCRMRPPKDEIQASSHVLAEFLSSRSSARGSVPAQWRVYAGATSKNGSCLGLCRYPTAIFPPSNAPSGYRALRCACLR